MQDININDFKISETEKSKLLIKNVNNRPNAMATYGQAKKTSEDVKGLFDQQFEFVAGRFNELCDGITSAFSETENKFEEVEKDFDDADAELDGRVSANEEAIAALDGRVSANEEAIAALDGFESKLNDFEEDLDTINNGGLLLKEEFIGTQVSAWLDEHPEATTTVQDDSITIKKLKAGELFIAPQMFGAVGDGVTDDTEAIQAAVDALGDYGVLYFPHGEYLVSVSSAWTSIITIYQRQNILICGDNAKIKVAANGFVGYNIINIKDSDNVTVRGLVLEGDRVTHDYTTTSSTHEWCYGINVIAAEEGCAVNVHIDNCEIFNMPGDCVVTDNGLGSGVIKITNCNLHHSRRQGISVLDSDVVQIVNCEIHHIGTHDEITGAAPQSGIDIEPTSGSLQVNKVELRNTKIYECSNYAMVSGQPEYCNECVAVNCEFLNGLAVSPVMLLENCRLGNENNHIAAQGSKTTFVNCRMYLTNMFLGIVATNCQIYGTEDVLVRVQYVELLNCYVENCKINHSPSGDYLRGAKMTTFHNVDCSSPWDSTNAGSFDMCNFTGTITRTTQANANFVFNNCYCVSKPAYYGVYNGGYIGE